MKKKTISYGQTLDKNRVILTGLCGICVLLILAIFVLTSRTSVREPQGTPVHAADVADAYAFLEQEEAVEAAAQHLDEPCTYGAYRTFLETLHLWQAAGMEALFDWDAQSEKALSADVLTRTREQAAELFDMPASGAGQEAFATASGQEQPSAQPLTQLEQMDAQTRIRVLLLQDGNCVGAQVLFSANAPYTITFHGKTKTKKKDQVIRASQLKLAVGESASVTSQKGEVYLADKNGARKTLGYSGSLRITRYAEGYAVVNEVPIEDYLYGVVQSEMPAYFEKEALKAQAVCARTYILTQLGQNNYPQYDADVDDSVRFQVYNQAAPDARVIEAVQEVCGMVLLYDAALAQTYFFSTSYGVTSGRELWGLSDVAYLRPVRGNSEQKLTDVSTEEAFQALLAQTDTRDYDFSSSYYRWRAVLQMDSEECTEKALALLEKLRRTDAKRVVLASSGKQEPVLADFGALQQLRVLERAASGAVRRVQLSFAAGSVELSNENDIRQVLGIWMQGLTDKNGDALSVANHMLPSVYFCVQTEKDGVTLSGGGLGHGIGMSQYGANGMAKAGKQMEEIVQTYYPGTTLYRMYQVTAENETAQQMK